MATSTTLQDYDYESSFDKPEGLISRACAIAEITTSAIANKDSCREDTIQAAVWMIHLMLDRAVNIMAENRRVIQSGKAVK